MKTFQKIQIQSKENIVLYIKKSAKKVECLIPLEMIDISKSILAVLFFDEFIIYDLDCFALTKLNDKLREREKSIELRSKQGGMKLPEAN